MASLGDILIRKGYISEEQLQMSLREQKRTGKLLGDILIQQGFVKDSDLSEALADQTGGTFVDIKTVELDPEAVTLVPEDFAREKMVVPILIGHESATLMVAMANSFDLQAIDDLQRMTGRYVDVVQATETDVLTALERCYAKTSRLKEEQTLDSLISSAEKAIGSQKDPSDTGGVASLVEYLLIYAMKHKATDIHIEPTETIVRTRYRVDGELDPGPVLPKTLQSAITTRLKIMANLDISISRSPQDGQLNFQYGSKTITLRFSSLPIVDGEKMVMRVLDKSGLQVDMEKLGFLPKILPVYKQQLKSPYGVILVTGPTGSGKTTTLYSSLMYLNSIDKNISTLEDPVEYTLPLICQSQINEKAGLTFAGGLRALLRQDPDIILVGEMRDAETASIAIQAALTGHLVLSTLHTNEACGVFPRLIDMGVESFLVSSAILSVLAQRLVRRVCGNCGYKVKEYTTAHEQIMEELGISPKEANFREGRGCDTCNGSGSKGRVGVMELLTVDDEIRQLALEGADSSAIKRCAVKNGMITLRQDALIKTAQGAISLLDLERSGLWHQKIDVGS